MAATELAPVGVDPLAAEAPLVFCFSPLVGTPLTTSAEFAVVAKSPLTGLLTDALADCGNAARDDHPCRPVTTHIQPRRRQIMPSTYATTRFSKAVAFSSSTGGVGGLPASS